MNNNLSSVKNTILGGLIVRVNQFIYTYYSNSDLYGVSKSTLRYILSDTIAAALKQKPVDINKNILFTPDDAIDQIEIHCQRAIFDRRHLAYTQLDSRRIKTDSKALAVQNQFTDMSIGCVEGIVTVTIDCVGMCVAPLGISSTEARVIANDAIEKSGAAAISGLQAAVEAIANAQGALDTAKAIVGLFLQFINTIGLEGFLESVWSALPWYRWIVIGAIAAAQITAWVATDGVALAAEIALETLAIATTVEDAIDAVNKCRAGDY